MLFLSTSSTKDPLFPMTKLVNSNDNGTECDKLTTEVRYVIMERVLIVPVIFG
jgi:hypothetical protein